MIKFKMAMLGFDLVNCRIAPDEILKRLRVYLIPWRSISTAMRLIEPDIVRRYRFPAISHISFGYHV